MADDTMPTPSLDAATLETVVVQGDLSKLTPAQRLAYYRSVCESLGLNPLTRPFQYIVLNNRLTLYASRDAADQLRRIHRISMTIVSRELIDDVYVVTARGTMPDGRTDEATGAVVLTGLRGDAKANALMKAETKAKRRLTLSMVGLGWLDETEVSTIPDAHTVAVDWATGEIPDVDGTAHQHLRQVLADQGLDEPGALLLISAKLRRRVARLDDLSGREAQDLATAIAAAPASALQAKAAELLAQQAAKTAGQEASA